MEQVLQTLKQSFQEFVSGEMLAQQAGITRAGVWKQVQQLRENGYQIESVPHKGHRLLAVTQALHPLEIAAGLQTAVLGQSIIYHTEVDSTNIEARKLAIQGAPEGTLVIAETQTKGKGRLGRIWASAAGKGIWLSLVLRPQISTSCLAGLTTVTAVALAQAIQEACGLSVQIKWPNDLMIQGKKIVGILAEISGEVDRVHYLILGVGLNVNQDQTDFPPELADKASSLKLALGQEAAVDRKTILQIFLKNLERDYLALESGMGAAIRYARENSATLGRVVTVSQGLEKNLTGKAIDLDEDGSLWLEEAHGKLHKVYSGDILENMEEN